MALLAVLCLASCKPKRQVNVQQGPAVIEFDNDERIYNFGTVSRQQGSVSHDFVFVNKGSDSVYVNNNSQNLPNVRLVLEGIVEE